MKARLNGNPVKRSTFRRQDLDICSKGLNPCFKQFVPFPVPFFLLKRRKKCGTKEPPPFIPANPLPPLVSRCAGEREAMWLRCHCRLQSGWGRQPGGAADQPQQELSGSLGPDRGSLSGLPEWGPELRPGRCRHLHRLQYLLHWHGQYTGGDVLTFTWAILYKLTVIKEVDARLD